MSPYCGVRESEHGIPGRNRNVTLARRPWDVIQILIAYASALDPSCLSARVVTYSGTHMASVNTSWNDSSKTSSNISSSIRPLFWRLEF